MTEHGFGFQDPGALPPDHHLAADEPGHRAEIPAEAAWLKTEGFALELSGAQFVWTMNADRPAHGHPLPKADEEQHPPG